MVTFIIYIFVGSVLIQLLYWLGIFSKLAFYKEIPHQTAPPQGVSVIVCAWNELENLQKLIPVLLNQKHSEFELIIVDDRSNDDCYDFLLFESFKHEKMKLVRINDTPDHITPKKAKLGSLY